MVNFLHIPKTGGNSVKSLVEGYGDKVAFWGHRIKQEIPNPSFCFVRNPYDRLVSAYFYLTDNPAYNEPDISYGELLKKYSGFRDFVLSMREDRLDKAIIHLKPMSYYICNAEGQIAIDHVFKVESPRLIDRYLKSIGIKGTFRNTFMNTSDHAPYKEYLELKTVAEINRIYADDFKNFNYKMIRV